jgi:hypothetical protein
LEAGSGVIAASFLAMALKVTATPPKTKSLVSDEASVNLFTPKEFVAVLFGGSV